MRSHESKKNISFSGLSKQKPYANGNIAILDKHIKLPKLGLVRLAKSRKVEGRLINVTVRRNPSGKYFVSILVETEVGHHEKTGSSVGIDVGLTNFATLSDGTVYENPRFFRTLEKKLAKAQVILSRRQIGINKKEKWLEFTKRLRMQEKICWIKSLLILSKTTTLLV